MTKHSEKMNVCTELRKTSKGKLHYGYRQNAEGNNNNAASFVRSIVEDEIKPVLNLSINNESDCLEPECEPIYPYLGLDSYPSVNISKNNNHDEETLYTTCYSEISDKQNEKIDTKNQSNIKTTLPSENDGSHLFSHKYNSSIKSILEFEEMYGRRKSEKLAKKHKEFEDNSIYAEKLANERLQSHIKQQEDKFANYYNLQTKQLLLNDESHKVFQQKIKMSHKQHQQMLNAKVIEVERRKQLLKDEDRKRQEQFQELRQKIQKMIDKCNDEYESCSYKEYLPEGAKSAHANMKNLQMRCNSLCDDFQNSTSKDENLKTLKMFLEDVIKTIDAVKVHLAEAEKKAREQEKIKAEAKNQTSSQQQSSQPSQPTPPSGQPEKPTTGQQTQPITTAGQQVQAATTKCKPSTPEDVMVDALEEYTKLQGLLKDVTDSLNNFNSDPAMKKYKFELQKAVNIPINAIAPENPSHLYDKLKRLTLLMFGEDVEVSGKKVSAKAAPEGVRFCRNLAARMIVKKGSEQVSSKHETAFAIAAVAVGLWCYDVEFGNLLLAHFQKSCPYIVPFILPQQEKQSIEKYHEYLGYIVQDGVIEEQVKFLKRMSGIMRLYAAIIVSPTQSKKPHPHGVEHAWIWLTRVLNSDPQPDITTTMIYDMLYVTGFALFDTYRNQFLKLLASLFKDYLPKLRSVAINSGPVSRLETFIENVIKNQGRIPKPEGLLPPNFI